MNRGLPTPKEGHVGVNAGPFGPHVFLIHDHTGKMVNVEPTRHDARGWIAKLARVGSVKEDWYEIKQCRAGEVRLMDLRIPSLGGNA